MAVNRLKQPIDSPFINFTSSFHYTSAICKPKSAALPSSPKTFGIIRLRILITFCLVVTSSTAASEGWKCSRGYIG